MPERIVTSSQSAITLYRPDSGFSKCPIWVESVSFYRGEVSGRRKGRKQNSNEPFLVIGFDTEFKTPSEALSLDEVREGKGKYTVLSYQFYAKAFQMEQHSHAEWRGICYPQNGERISLGQLLVFAFWKGITSGAISKIPRKIYLVGHFTRADIPAFSDFQDMSQLMSSVRNTFLSVDSSIPVSVQFADGTKTDVDVILRDTMLLTPATSKSLATLGELVDIPKLSLSPDPKEDLYYKRNMDLYLAKDPKGFEDYALNDALICVRYIEEILEQVHQLSGIRKVPATITSIGIDLLWKNWDEDRFISSPYDVLGKEAVKEKVFDRKKGYYVSRRKIVPYEEVAWHEELAKEAFHGGRNEQFWFGPSFEDDWTDYDLSGAYPTAMALIGRPDWKKIRVTNEVDDFTPLTLGVAAIQFEFPHSVRFPSLPVRTENGLIFPRTGFTTCASPEIALAKSLGANIKIRHGVIVPTNEKFRIFGDYISECIKRRKSFKKGTLREQFWKELSNSTYGKTAQGLRGKRVYDLKLRKTEVLPESRITNPYFASYITSFVRATLGEIINALPDQFCVFSCTTDGFLTNATPEQMKQASSGVFSKLFAQSRYDLTGNADVLEIKHQVRRLLGWRTRGQATLKPGATGEEGIKTDNLYVLAKGGIYLDEEYDTTESRNQYIIDTFFDRTPDDRITMKIKTGIRDIVEFDADLVDKEISKRLNMEFDWKRKPRSVVPTKFKDHIAFSTDPWDSLDQFVKIRELWEEYAIRTMFCMKSIDDFRDFATYALSQTTLKADQARYLKRQSPDLKRLRQSLCSAWRRSMAGLTWKQADISNAEFSEILTDAGIPCKRTDVENGAKKPFIPNICPATPDVLKALEKLKKRFPKLRRDVILNLDTEGVDFLSALNRKDLLTAPLIAERQSP